MKKVLVIALALAMMMTACLAFAEEAVKVGVIGPLTGANAQYGLAVQRGAQIAAEEINAQGGLQLEILAEDDQADGELAVKESQLKFIKDRYPVLGLPLVRGVVTFCASMVEGVKALMFSAEFYPEDEEAEPEEPSKFELWLEKRLGSEKMASLVVTLAVILGIGMSIGLFFLLPTLLGTAVTVVTDSMLVRNVAESLLKLAIFVGYLALCSRMKDIHRVFEYHGAEHKTIFCYEAGLPLTVENVRRQPRHHPRCGTSFLFMVIAISIIVSTIVFAIWPVHHPLLRFLAHLLMLPIIVGVSYEFNRWAGRHDGPITKILTAPGLWLHHQRAGRLHDRGGDYGAETGAARGERRGRVVKCRMQECRMQNECERARGGRYYGIAACGTGGDSSVCRAGRPVLQGEGGLSHRRVQHHVQGEKGPV